MKQRQKSNSKITLWKMSRIRESGVNTVYFFFGAATTISHIYLDGQLYLDKDGAISSYSIQFKSSLKLDPKCRHTHLLTHSLVCQGVERNPGKRRLELFSPFVVQTVFGPSTGTHLIGLNKHNDGQLNGTTDIFLSFIRVFFLTESTHSLSLGNFFFHSIFPLTLPPKSAVSLGT